MVTYWYLRMKEGRGGKDFTKEMWEQDLIGVLWGTWKIDHVLSNGQVDPDKLTVSAIQEACEQPEGLNFNAKSLQVPRKFLLEQDPGEHMVPGDRVVVSFDGSLHIGRVGQIYDSMPDATGKDFGEQFKCRHVYKKKSFALKKLPASFRLISGTGQGTLQRMKAYAALVQLLDRHTSEKEIQDTLKAMSPEEFLLMLSDKQWEVICGEYLRKEVGYRSLLLAIGGNLKDIDLCGVDNNGTRLLVQCKNSSNPWRVREVAEWASDIDAEPDDSLYFFNRGGFEGSDRNDHRCNMISGEDIKNWLEEAPDYFSRLKTLYVPWRQI